jgi:hypothetical protein
MPPEVEEQARKELRRQRASARMASISQIPDSRYSRSRRRVPDRCRDPYPYGGRLRTVRRGRA